MSGATARGRRTVALLLLAVSMPLLTPPARGQEPGAGGGTAPDAPAVQEPAGSGGRSALTDPREAELDGLAAEVAGELRCPVCRNQSVLESNAELSREMQRVVRERLEAGQTPEEVKAYFVSRYGEWILLQPRARGINLLVYGLPVVALVAGFLLARNRLRAWAAAGSAAQPPSAGAGLSAADEEWLKQALRGNQGT